MSYRSTLPTWYVNPLLNHGLNICTMCGSQSFVDIRIPICPQCDGIIADSPRNARYEHLCTNCSRRCTICRCAYPSSNLFLSPSSESLNSSSCSCYDHVPDCCYCYCCSYFCTLNRNNCRCCCCSRCD
ncbi:unnamed protein product [Adineta ricciae]|uniref:Uncharacterized protein n=1 Tax=Adineta ricciae TaxID=249248 RepID=A0A814PQR3_ADIRI|nr:unnamed protein product [Adineta ricciae]